MPHSVRLIDDLKSAAVLAGAAGVCGALTVPVLLPPLLERMPVEQRTLPLPLPLFCGVLALQFLVVYGLVALAGLRLARARQREGVPLLSALWTGQPRPPMGGPAGLAFGTGLACGFVLVGAVHWIGRFLPNSLPSEMHPPTVWGALLASATASIGEEIICRLFLLNALLRVLPVTRIGTLSAVVVSSLLFGALHAPGAVVLFGGLDRVPGLFWVWLIALNAIVGVACAVWFLRSGMAGAILVHFGTDLVWHVLSQV